MLTRQKLETYQALIYVLMIAGGLAIGMLFPGWINLLDGLLWPILALLLYVTFAQVPLVHLRQAIGDVRFVMSAVVGNFLLVPLLTWGLLQWVPADPSLRLGVLLVLLVPCTDWFITFSHLGGGDTKRAIALSPISLLLQLFLLPFYLWLFLGETVAIALAQEGMIVAFVGLIIMPLIAAFLTEKWVEQKVQRRQWLGKLAWFPIPILGVVVFVIAATQVNLLAGSLGILGRLLLVFGAFLVLAGLLAWILAGLFKLPSAQGRVLAFSLGTRNSFVVLPLALALPSTFDLTVVAIVFQSLVELMGMVVYLWWVPAKLFPRNASE